MSIVGQKKRQETYHCMEQGPIRPPAEARSLLIRVARNCPWNRCTFCPLYKGKPFSVRPLEHIIKDIDTIHGYIEIIQDHGATPQGKMALSAYVRELTEDQIQVFDTAYQWYQCGMESIFLQDANALVLRAADLIAILEHLKQRFPRVRRITAFARSHTILRKKLATLQKIAAAGLNRVHVGLETGSDRLLKWVKKGCTQAMHIEAGLKIKAAGIELSECVLAGLGGALLYEEHARETAVAVNRINPHIIRFLTLAVPQEADLYPGQSEVRFLKSTDVMVAKEIKYFLEQVHQVTTFIESDNILNLFQEVKGRMPMERERMLAPLSTFLEWEPERQMLFQVGKRLQIVSRLTDLQDAQRVNQVRQMCCQNGITPHNVDAIITQMLQRFF